MKQVLTLATAAFGLVAALAWNDAIQAIVNRYLSFSVGSEVVSKVVYALIVTILAVVVTTNLARIQQNFEDQKPKN